jgi:beta propeller repeat protein
MEFENALNETVIIFIENIGPLSSVGIDKVILNVTFDMTGDPYSTVLFVNDESWGFIEYRYTIFTIPATDTVKLEFGAQDITIRIDKLGADAIVWNELDNVVVKGKTYWEEYQRYWSGAYWGHRSIISLPEPPDMFPPRHSVDITSPDGVTLKHMAVNEDGIYDYNEVLFGHRNVTLRSDTTFFKVWTNDSNFYRLQFNWMAYEPPSVKVKHADIGFGVGGGTRAGGEGPIELSDDTPDEGDLVEIQVKILNTGDASSSQFNTTVYLDRINGSTQIGNNVTQLAPWQNKTVTFIWDTNGTFGNHTIRAVLDEDNYVQEWNESNHASIEVFVNSTKLYQDADTDLLPDAWEDEWGLNKSDASGINGTYGDPDQDGLHNLAEYQNNTLPMISDTDNDTLLDGDNNTLALLRLVILEEKGTFDDHRFYLIMSRFETSEGEDIPYGGYRIPTLSNQYFNTSEGQPNENLSKSYIVKDMPIEVYNKGNSTPQGVFYITADKVNLSASSETPFDFENDNIKIRVNASLILNATFDPDPLVKDADWDGLEDAWEMVYLDTRGIDFRGIDSDGDGVEDILDVDSDNDHRTDGGDMRLFYFPIYEGEEYDYPLVQEGVRSHGESTGPLSPFGNRYPEFCVNQSSPNLMDIGMTDPKDNDVDGDGLLDGVEPRNYGSDPLLSDTDADGMDDAMEVQMWFTYDNVSIDKRFFDDSDLALLNLSGYYEAHYRATIYADVRTNVDTEEDISDSLVIEIVETDEWQSRLTELEYTAFYDASGLDDSFTWIPVLFNFSFDTLVEDSPWIYISPNRDVFPPTLSDMEVHLKYTVMKILGSDVASGDTDGDGLSDYTELQMGTSISKVDTDSDRITDKAEKIFWFGPVGIPSYEQAVKLRTSDVDDDGLLDGFEVLHSTNPEEADEDNDLLLDFEEVLNYVTMWHYNLTETLVDLGTLSHEFAVSAKGDFLITLTINNTINRSVAYYDEDLLYEDDYMDEMNTWFMNNSSTVKYCHKTNPSDEYCKTAKYDSDAIILNVTRFGNYVNTTELRKVYIFRNVTTKPIGIMGMDVHRVIYDLNVVEPQALVVANFTEFFAGRRGVHPFNPDFDLDGVMDGLEVEVGANPYWLHSDQDMLNDYDEYYGTKGVRTNLTNEDTDDDGVWDGYDRGGTGQSMPTHWGELTRGTNATDPDTDGDGLQDGFELGLPPGAPGTSNPTLWDTDNDSMSDGWEYHHGLNPYVIDGGFDPDGDGLNNSQEFVADTDPHDEDIDDDLLEDGEEIYGVLFRTNVTDGAQSVQNYESQEGYKWIFYNSTSHKKYQYNDQSANTWWVICSYNQDQDRPRTHGEIVVWHDSQTIYEDIYFYNVTNETIVRITNGPEDHMNPDVYAHWDIWAYNISSGEEFRITDNKDNQTNPSIHGDTIVWVDDRNGNESNGYKTDIYMYNIQQGYVASVTNDSYNETSPMVYENTVVWVDDQYSSDNIYLHQPSGGRYLVNDSAQQKNPQIHGDYVVWEDYRDGNWEIYLHDLRMDNQTRVTKIASEQKNVAIYGDKLLWEDYRDGNAEIYLYNISTEVKVKVTDNVLAQTSPAIFKDRFVWVDKRSGNEDIYMYNLTQFGSLGDGAPTFYNSKREEIYVWEHDDSFFRFNETDSSEPCTITVPTIGYRNMEMYEGPNIRHPDSDFDGLLDGRNTTVDKDSALFDYYMSYELPYIDNGDGTSTFVGEKSMNTDPLKMDSDVDNIKDATEVFGYNVSVKRANGSVEEKFVYTDPANDDTDNDLLIDGRELSFKTDPTHPDADDDSLIDGYNVTTTTISELFTYFTSLGIQYKTNPDTTVTFVGELSMGSSPTNNESDGDGVPDDIEVFVNDTHPAYVDTDKDGLPDGYEIFYYLDPKGDDTDGDAEGDGFSNIHEYMYGTHPRHWDTDFDGMSDAWEWEYGLKPLDNGTDVYDRQHNKSLNLWYYDVLSNEGNITRGPDGDVDNDGLTNVEEYDYMKSDDWDETQDGTWESGLDPLEWDTDSDNVSDFVEVKDDTYWWEAENYTTNDVVDDSANFASGGFAAKGTSSDPNVFWINWSLPSPTMDYKIFIKARKTTGTDGSLEVFNGTSLLFTLNINNQTYNWYNSTSEYDIRGHAQVSIRGRDVNGTEPSFYVDKVLLATFDTVLVDKVYDGDDEVIPLTFDMDETEKIWVKIPLWGPQTRYVSNATLYFSGSGVSTAKHPALYVGDKTSSDGPQWWFDGDFLGHLKSATLDLAGEFNQYLLAHDDDDDEETDGNISIPMKFDFLAGGSNGIITVYAVVVLLTPYVSDPLDNDTDSDWLIDGRERLQYNTSSLAPDSDNDELTDWTEVTTDLSGDAGLQHSDPSDSDTDDDLDDDQEDLDPLINDIDYDGVLDGIERRMGLDPEDPDSDGDGLADGFNITVKFDTMAYWFLINESILYEEINPTYFNFFGEHSFGTDPLKSDSDGDELGDGGEVSGGTDPLNPDTDGDGLLDGGDVVKDQSDWRFNCFTALGIIMNGTLFLGENYKTTGNKTPDTDGDGLPDGWEVKFWLNPHVATGRHGPEGDLDGDGITNLDEFYYKTSPTNTDTDDDDLPDDWEISYGLDPLHSGTLKYVLKKNYDYDTVSSSSVDDGPNGNPDGDKNGGTDFKNLQEYGYDTSPTTADTDGDGLIDGNNMTVSRYNWRFKMWDSQGIPYINVSNNNVKFLGESAYDTDRTNPDTDFDNATDGQELHGYKVMVCWYEGEELRSENKTIYGHPLEAYMELDGVTPLDVDEDGITDLDEMDPVNSTTMSVEDFVEIYGDNQTMMDSQFNPFIRESTPPIVLNIAITKHERWGDCVTLGISHSCLKRLWAEIEVEALDVSDFSVTVTISEDDERTVTFVGKGHEWFMVAMDLRPVEVLVRYKVSIMMEDFAGNELDSPYEKEMDGLFGGVLAQDAGGPVGLARGCCDCDCRCCGEGCELHCGLANRDVQSHIQTDYRSN